MFRKRLLPLVISTLFVAGVPLHAQEVEEASASSSSASGPDLPEVAAKVKDFFAGLFSSDDSAVQESVPIREAGTVQAPSGKESVASDSSPKSLGLSVESDIEVSDADRKAAEAEIAAREAGTLKDDTDDYGVSEEDPVNVLKQKADQGYVDAQYYLGKAYATGKGVRKDQERAVEWYRKAAENGNADAQNNLGAAYANGHGVGKSDE
ncbi:MAG: tetratricopeptide repeat protein, partial [Oxalobacter sp.]